MALSNLCAALADLSAQCSGSGSTAEFCSSVQSVSSDCAELLQQQANRLIPIWLSILLVVLLVLLSGLFSGLNLGLLTLSMRELNILINVGSEPFCRHAKRIIKVRKHGNWLLCTLLLANVVVNAALTILLDNLFLSNAWMSFAVSATAITFFGEILPQAVCSRKALVIGYYAVPFVFFVMILFGPIAWPIGKFFDLILGDEIGYLYSNEELKQLIDMHIEQEKAELSEEQGRIIRGAIDYLKLCVADVMTPWKDVFSLYENTKLTFSVLIDVFKTGYSRIPILNSAGEAVGILFVKDLILIDPEDETPVGAVLELYKRHLQFISESSSLRSAMKGFSLGHNHLALVYSDPPPPRRQTEKEPSSGTGPTKSCRGTERARKQSAETVSSDETETNEKRPKRVEEIFEETKKNGQEANQEKQRLVGIITMEDIVEKILNFDIVDETDVYVNKKEKNLVLREPFDITKLDIFDYRRSLPRVTLIAQEITAAARHLGLRLAELGAKTVNPKTVKLLLRLSKVTEVILADAKERENDAKARKEISDGGLWLYREGKPNDFFYIILDGQVRMLQPGVAERDSQTLHRWDIVGDQILRMELDKDEDVFVPDFSAVVIVNSRILRINRADFREILDS